MGSVKQRSLFAYGKAIQQVYFSLLFYLFYSVYHYLLSLFVKTTLKMSIPQEKTRRLV
jgi:hypothetical protein